MDIFVGELITGQVWFITEIKAYQANTDRLTTWVGPMVPGISFSDAQKFCDENIGYCKVVGKLDSIGYVDDYGVSVIRRFINDEN